MPKTSFLFFIVVSQLLACGAAQPVGPHPDRFVATKTIRGHFVSFAEGDYLHATIRANDGTVISFFSGAEYCFLAEHHKEALQIKYKEVQSYFPEGGGYYPANRIISISTDKGFRWSAKADGPTTSQERDRCEQIVDALTEKR